MSPEPSEQLIERIRNREVEALAEYLTEVKTPLLAFIERRLSDALRRKIEAEDIFQETMAAAITQLPEASFDFRDPFSWLCQLAEYRLVDAHRHFFDAQKRDAGREVQPQVPAEASQNDFMNLIVASMTSPSQAFSKNAKQASLDAAIGQLPEEQREVLNLRYVQGLPTKAIAEKLGKSDASVRVMLTRALQKLERSCGGGAP
jgi:RNA polymerase sigma-70 factor (ECF subfamily)